MPKIVDAALQRREIRDAARRVFARRGVRGTGLAQVADAAGMGRSSLYHYYKDKSALVRDLLRDLLSREEALFTAVATAPGSPMERIGALGRALPPLFDEWVSVGKLLLELRSTDASRFRPFFRRIRAAFASLVAEGQGAGEIDPTLDPEVVSATVIGAIDGVLLQILVDPTAFDDRDAVLTGLVDLMRRAVRP